MVYELTFMAYKLRLLWHTNPDSYAIWTVFIGGGGGLQFVEDASSRQRLALLQHFLSRSGLKLRRADTQTPTRHSAFSTSTPIRERFPHSTAYECLKAFFRHASVFKTHRHAVYQCLKKPPTFFRHASVFETLVSTRACPFLNARFRPSKDRILGVPKRGFVRGGNLNHWCCMGAGCNSWFCGFCAGAPCWIPYKLRDFHRALTWNYLLQPVRARPQLLSFLLLTKPPLFGSPWAKPRQRCDRILLFFSAPWTRAIFSTFWCEHRKPGAKG